MGDFAFGFVDGHLVVWTVRDITWCAVCGEREGTTSDGLCVRCDADALLLLRGFADDAGPEPRTALGPEPPDHP